MSDLFITHAGKKHKVREATIQTWSEIMKHKDLLDETEMFVKTIELLTDIPRTQIMEASADEVYLAGEAILGHLNSEKGKVHSTIEHKGQEYKFIDINDVSFGQFIDIDTFLSKDENYKQRNLNELAAYLYIEQGTKYGDRPVSARKEAFVDLPMKYLEGAVFFLASSAKTSEILTKIYSESTMVRWTARIKIISALIGAGIQQSALSVKTKYGYLMSLLLYPLFSVSIISLTLWTLIKSSRKNKKK